MSEVLEIVSGVIVLIGALFCVIGGIGIVRLPDLYCRTHAATITDTLGAGLMLMGLTLLSGWSLVTVKLILILILLYITSPTAAHALVKAAHAKGVLASVPHGIENRLGDGTAILVRTDGQARQAIAGQAAAAETVSTELAPDAYASDTSLADELAQGADTDAH